MSRLINTFSELEAIVASNPDIAVVGDSAAAESKPKKRNKYNARKVTIDGIKFDSQAEGRDYLRLRARQDAGEISELTCHPRFCIIDGYTTKAGKKVRAAYYTADFSFIENGIRVVVEIKGGKATITEAYRLRVKLFQQRYKDIEFREIRR